MNDTYIGYFLALISPLVAAAWGKPELYRKVVTHWVFFISLSIPAITVFWNLIISYIKTEISIEESDVVAEIRAILDSMMIPAAWSFYASATMIANLLLSRFADNLIDSEQRIPDPHD